MNGLEAVWTATAMLWVAAAAWMDWRRRRVWWAWFILGGLAAGVYRLIHWLNNGFAFDQLLLIAAVILAAFQLWRARVWGGADAKTAMVLILVSPDWRMVLVLALVDVAVVAGWVLARQGLEGLSRFGGRIRSVLRGEALERSETIPLVAVMAVGYGGYILLFG